MSGSGVGEASVRIEQAGAVDGHGVRAATSQDGERVRPGEDRTAPRQLPGAVRHVANRAREQDALTAVLTSAKTHDAMLISAIDGAAGVGKSTFAVHWAHRERERFPDGELYLDLRGSDPADEPVTAAEALGSFLAALGLPAERIPVGTDARAELFRNALLGKRMLLLLDDARSTEQIRPLLPGNPSCPVLVTSRSRLDDLVIREGAARMTLDVLNRADALDLLGRHLGHNRVESDLKAVDSLIEQCAGLPLALGIVAVRAAEDPKRPLGDLVAELQDERERLESLDLGGETGIRAVFSWSYHALSPGAARLFRLLGLPNGPDISLGATADLAGLPLRQVRGLLVELVRVSLLEQHASGRYRFHDLIRAYAAECVVSDESPEDRRAAIQRLLDHYLRTSRGIHLRFLPHARQVKWEPPPSDVEARVFSDGRSGLNWWHAEKPNLLAAVRLAAQHDLHEHSWQLAQSLSYFFELRGNPEESIATYEVALDAARRTENLEAEGQLLLNAGSAHHLRQQYEHSIRCREGAVKLFQRAGNRAQESIALVALSETKRDLRHFGEAKELLASALELEEPLGDPLQLGKVHTGLGSVAVELADFDDAVEHLRQALLSYQKVEERNGEGFARDTLASAYRRAGRLDDAVSAYREAVAFRREQDHRQGEAESLRGLGDSLHEAGDLEEARTCWQRSLAILEEVGHPMAEVVRGKLAEA